MAKSRSRSQRAVTALVTLVVGLAVLYGILDFAASSVADNQLASAIARRTSAGTVSVSVDRVPFLFDLLADGKVDRVSVSLDDMPIDHITASRVLVSAGGVTIDRGDLFSERKVRLEKVSSATASVTVTAAELSQATGHRVDLRAGDKVDVAIGSAMVPASISITTGDVMTLNAGGTQLLSVDLASSPIVPTCPLRLAVSKGAATLSCHLAPVPSTVVGALNGES